jgi:predicted SAM-dependent methyltransferase
LPGLGSGKVPIPSWINIDVESNVADVCLDLRKPLPFPDRSVAFIFAEHFIEHLSREEGVGLLRECARVLVDEGVLRLSTPDLKWLVAMYLIGRVDEWGELWAPSSPCCLVNEGMRNWGHLFVYDSSELAAVLAEAGFLFVRAAKWRESIEPELSNLETRPYHRELIVEATKTPNPAFSKNQGCCQFSELQQQTKISLRFEAEKGSFIGKIVDSWWWLVRSPQRWLRSNFLKKRCIGPDTTP